MECIFETAVMCVITVGERMGFHKITNQRIYTSKWWNNEDVVNLKVQAFFLDKGIWPKY